MQDVKVRVIDRGRRFYYMRAETPGGQRQERSTGVEVGGRKQRREAERVAAKWESELQDGRYKAPSKMSWSEFTDRYDREVLSGLAEGTAEKAWGTFNAVNEILKPKRLQDLSAERISRFQAVLRERGRADDTILGHLAHLKASLRWASKMGMLHSVPDIVMPKRAKGASVMKGRPITGEEFERVLMKVQSVCCETLLRRRTQLIIRLVRKRAGSQGSDKLKQLNIQIDTARIGWEHFLWGLWWSGLRIDEAMHLSWDIPGTVRIDTDGRYVMLRIGAANEKAHKDRLYPVAPEFAEMIEAVPAAERSGWFFNVAGVRGNRPRTDTVSKTITAIGRRANVVVDPDSQKVKHASAHDLRRAFGFRWSERVMPAQLKELMRHESISTTMRYYVGRNAEATAAALYAAVPGKSRLVPAERIESEAQRSDHR